MAQNKKIDAPARTWDRLFANVGQLAMITTIDSQGRVNAATFATCVRAVHDPVQIAFTTSDYKHTYLNIKETGQFTVNLPSFEREMLEKAVTLGLPFERGVNELEKAGFTSLPATKVKPPRIAEAHRHFECEVVWTKEWLGRVMIVGNCVAASVDVAGSEMPRSSAASLRKRRSSSFLGWFLSIHSTALSYHSRASSLWPSRQWAIARKIHSDASPPSRSFIDLSLAWSAASFS